jgi:hypothetical protein
MRFFVLFIIFLLSSCSGIEESQIKEIKERNERKDLVHRYSDQVQYPESKLLQRIRDPYPWEKEVAGAHPRVTKEMFRCRGDTSNPSKSKAGDKTVAYHDCGGVRKHSLPVRNGKEFIYPILLDLLNYIQLKTGCPVVVTCGHRCPAHNSFSDPSTYQMNSKHMIGAEVDFYVKGMEDRPLEVIDIMMDYYKETKTYKEDKEYTKFQRLDRVKVDVSTLPWYNKEIFIKLYKKGEGRDFDNKHPHAYIGLQVRFDREKNERVVYSWDKAFNGYMRY